MNGTLSAQVSAVTPSSVELRHGEHLQGTNGNASVEHVGDFEWSLYNSDSVLILFGTVMGNSELLANRLAAAARRAGLVVWSATWLAANRAY